MRWIDTHVHLFSTKDSDNTGMPLVHGTDSLNTSDLYLQMLGSEKPEAIVVVDFSKSKDSEHVINSLDDLKIKGVKAAGVIKANLNDERTLNWLEREDVKGIRLYAKESMPDVSGQKWADVFSEINKSNKHILVFGDGANLTGLIKQIPQNVTILVDHLGLPKISGEDTDFAELLSIAKARGNVYFKGPGYRTSLDIEKVKPLVRKIIQNVGSGRLILGASDSPFAGPVMESALQYQGKKYAELIDFSNVLKFIQDIADDVANDHSDKDKFLHANAKELYGF